jgi:hypothetical protein
LDAASLVRDFLGRPSLEEFLLDDRAIAQSSLLLCWSRCRCHEGVDCLEMWKRYAVKGAHLSHRELSLIARLPSLAHLLENLTHAQRGIDLGPFTGGHVAPRAEETTLVWLELTVLVLFGRNTGTRVPLTDRKCARTVQADARFKQDANLLEL